MRNAPAVNTGTDAVIDGADGDYLDDYVSHNAVVVTLKVCFVRRASKRRQSQSVEMTVVL